MSFVSLNLTILHININGFFSHRSELEARLCLFPALPLLILFNETKLDQSCPVPCLSGYTLIDRRDRHANGGGVLMFAMDRFACLFSPLPCSTGAEILWTLFHSQCGPILIACWHRPPHYGEVATINSFIAEWSRHSSLAIGTVLVGDLNLHHVQWLRFSRIASPEGIAMHNWCS